MTKLYVKDGAWQRKMVRVCVCVKVVCERWCVWRLCVKESVWQSCVCERWCVTKLCVKDSVVKDGVRQSCVWKMVWWKMVCDKVVCEGWCGERWCETKWCVKDGLWRCVKDGVWQSLWKTVCQRWCVKDGVWKMACDKVVCEGWCGERWCVTKWCVKDGVWKMVCERWCKRRSVTEMVCERGCVQDGVWQSCVWKMVCGRWCVKDDVSKMVCVCVCDKVGCGRGCVKDVVSRHQCQPATPAMRNEGGCRQVPPLPRKVWRRRRRPSAPKRAQARPSAPPEPAQRHKCHACHAKRRWISSAKVDVAKCLACHAKLGGVTGDQARPSGPPEPAQCHKCFACHAKRRWMSPSATPATRNEGGCRQVPRLHAKLSGVTGDQARPSAPPEPARCHKCYACHAKRRWMSPNARPRVPRKTKVAHETKVDVAKCHACHAKCSGVAGDQARPSAPKRAQARLQSQPSAISVTPATQNEVGCQVPRLKRKWMSPSALPAMQSWAASPATKRAQAGHQSQPSAISTTPATQNEGGCRQVPRLPRKTKADVTKCHACHAKRRWMSPSSTSATQSWAASPATKRAQARHQSQPDAISTPATQNEGGCRQGPRVPRKTKVARETKVDVAKCHACHAKLSGVTGDQARPSAPPEPAQCHKCHACHAKRRWMLPSATCSTQNEGGSHQVPSLSRKTKVDVAKCHAFHKVVCERWWVTKLCVKDGGWQSCVWEQRCVCDKVVCESWCVAKLCVKDGGWQSRVWQWCVTKMVGDKVVCERWCVCERCESGCVTKMVCDKVVCERWCVCESACVTKMVDDKVVCERCCVTQSCVGQCCMWKLVCDEDVGWQSCVTKMVGDKVVCERWCVVEEAEEAEEAVEAEEAEEEDPAAEAAGYRIKNKNPSGEENTNTNTRTTDQTPTRGGGGGRKRLTQLTRREPNLPRHAQDPNLTQHTGARMK